MTAFYLNVDQGEEAALAALQENRESHFVCVETKQQVVERTQLLTVFEGLARFDGMEQCFIKRIHGLPAESLASLLTRQQALDFLYLQNVSLQADAAGVQRLAEAFRSHRSLRKIRYWQAKPAVGTNVSLDPILSAMSSIPTLEEVALIHSKIVSSDEQEWLGNSLRDLCRSRSLKVLTLTFSTGLKDGHISLMVDSLKSSTALKSLSIRGNLGKAAGRSIANLLEGNPKLEQLRLQLEEDDHAMPVVESLKKNSNLKRMGLVLPRRVTNMNARKQFTALVAKMLRTSNYHLLHMDMGGLWTYNQDEIRFYLKANQVGRKRLLAEGATRDEWMETLVTHRDDISVVFYFLSKNPSLALSILDNLIRDPTAVATRASRKRRREETLQEDAKAFPKKKFREG